VRGTGARTPEEVGAAEVRGAEARRQTGAKGAGGALRPPSRTVIAVAVGAAVVMHAAMVWSLLPDAHAEAGSAAAIRALYLAGIIAIPAIGLAVGLIAFGGLCRIVGVACTLFDAAVAGLVLSGTWFDLLWPEVS
jgi:hypothetical protein